MIGSLIYVRVSGFYFLPVLESGRMAGENAAEFIQGSDEDFFS